MPYETVFDSFINKIAEAFQSKKADTITLKEFMNSVKPEELEGETTMDYGEKPLPEVFFEKGSFDYADRGRPPERPKTPITSMPMPIQQDFGKEYAPSSPYGSPEQQGQLRKDYEQNAFGLDGLREQFMNEGMPPNIGPQIQGFNGQLSNTNNTDNMITLLNASLAKRKNYRQDYGR